MSEQQDNFPPKNASPTDAEMLILYRTAWSELTAILALIGSIAGMIYFSILYPASIQAVPLFPLGESVITIHLPLFGLPPVVVLGYLIHALYNCRYVIGPDYVSETEGLISLNKIDRRIEFDFIRGVEVERGALGRIINFGDLKIGSAMQSEVEIHFRGVRDPSHLRNLVIQRMRAWEQSRELMGLRSTKKTE